MFSGAENFLQKSVSFSMLINQAHTYDYTALSCFQFVLFNMFIFLLFYNVYICIIESIVQENYAFTV